MRRVLKAVALTVALVVGIIAGTTTTVSTQAPFLVFGSQSGVGVAIKATGNALWVSLQGGSATTAPLTINAPGIAAVATPGLNLTNATAATAGVPVQAAPCLYFNDNVWNTTATAANNTDLWTLCSLPVSGTTPSGLLKFGSSLNGGGATFPMTLSSAGNVVIPGFTQAVSFISAPTGTFQWSGTATLRGVTGGQLNLLTAAETAGIGLDLNTDAIAKFRTRAQTGYATVDSGIYNNFGLPQIVFVTTDFSTAANTNLQIITGLTWTLPVTTAINIPFRCVIFYTQATAAVSDSFGVQTDTVTPSNFQAGGSMETALGTTAYGDATIANTTATAVVTGTPSATGTVFNAYVDGFLENPSNASTTVLSVQVKTSVSGDVITVKRGSFCRAF